MTLETPVYDNQNGQKREALVPDMSSGNTSSDDRSSAAVEDLDGRHGSNDQDHSPKATEGNVYRDSDCQRRDADTVDHGLVCWLQVVGVFAVWTNSWGICNAFGEFQVYYETNLHQSSSTISWVGSVQSFLLLFTGMVAGALSDAGYCRWLLIGGNLLVVLGMMLTSICTEYWQIMICQGIVTGIGCGCIFTPGVSILPQYFVKKRQWASGLAAVGSGFGGVIYPIVLHRLTPQIGFGWAVRVLAFIMLIFGIVAVVLLRSKLPYGAVRQIVSIEVFRDTPLLVYTAGLFAVMIVLYTPVVYIGSFSLHYHITDENLAFYLVPILQAAGIFGRTVPTFVADRTGPVNMTIPALVGASVMIFAWMGVRSVGSLMVFAILYGSFFGVILGLGPACVISLTADVTTLGSRTGTSFAIAAFGVLIGTPVAGAILGHGDNFIAMQAFVGSICVLSGLLYIAARYLKIGFSLAKI